MRIRCCAALVVFLGAVAAVVVAQGSAQQRIRIERAADLPVHTYRITTTVGELVRDPAQFAVFAKQLETDLRSDLDRYIIEDHATLKFYYRILSDLAVERGDYDEAVGWQDRIRAIEDKPSDKLTVGIIERALAVAAGSARDRFAESFRAAFQKEVSALPYPDVREALATLRQGAEYSMQPNALDTGLRLLEQQTGKGTLSLLEAQALVKMRANNHGRTPPLAPVIAGVLTELIKGNDAAKRDIWPEREASLEGRTGLTPIVVAIWDSGVDVRLFPGRLFVNSRETPDNGRDDDGNGYVDDVHGIAYDVKHERATGVLGPIASSEEEQKDYLTHLRGQADMTAGISSPEAAEFRKKLFSLGPANIRAWNEAVSGFEEYSHGTNVAHVAMLSNPAARVLVARNEEDNWKAAPESVSVATESKRAREFREMVDYFKRHGVRVVNMSWAYSPRFYEGNLARTQPAVDIEVRKRLAREMFEVIEKALRGAIDSAPDILFVTGAGNANDDVRFMERIPSGFELANLINVAAVNHAGDEAPFTSYGNVQVHANGSNIRTVAPGGAPVPVSGTSLAAPQVANLAVKLLALRPGLTVAELRRAIIDSTDEKKTGGGKTIRILNPKAAVDLVMRR